MKNQLIALLTAFLLLCSSTLYAESNLLVVRSKQAFPEAMLALQAAINKHGYKVARVQHVDIGLTKAGYKTDKYRIVFFGRSDEVRKLSTKYPDLIPFLPQSFSIFAEEDQTLVVTMNPTFLSLRYKQPELTAIFERWSKDVQAILADLRKISVDE